MVYRFKEEFISKIFLLGTFLYFLLIVAIIFSLTQNKLLIWIIIAPTFLIFLFGCVYYLKDYLLLSKRNIYHEIDELNYGIKKKFPLIILEIFFWLNTLSISILFLYIHGFYLVDYELYYEKAELFYYFLFGGNKPSSEILSQNIIVTLLYRPLYPLLIVIFHLPFSLFFSRSMSFNVSAIFINIISGFATLYFFGKIIKMLSKNTISKRIGRLIIGTTPTFIIFWTKFSTEFLFLLFFTISFYCLLKYSKYRRGKDLFLFLIASFLACLTREVGFFLFFSALGIIFNSKKKVFSTLKVTGFISIIILSFLIFSDTLIGNRYRYWYFVHKVYPVKPDYPYFHIFNFLKWLVILLFEYFSFVLMRNIFFSSLWSFGLFFILLIIYITSSFKKRIKKYWRNVNNKYINYLKKYLLKFKIKFDLKIFFSFFVPYFLFLLILIGTLISERYFLPLAILLIISYLIGSKKEISYKEQTLLVYGVIYNLILLAIRIIYISIVYSF